MKWLREKITPGPEHTFTGSVLGTLPQKSVCAYVKFFLKAHKGKRFKLKNYKFSQVACRVWLTYSSWGILLYSQIQMSQCRPLLHCLIQSHAQTQLTKPENIRYSK